MVPFGFSIGDFIAGINLLIEAASSLSDTHGAQADYQGLCRQLQNLNTSLDCIKSLDIDTMQSMQATALENTLNDCQQCVDDFIRINRKFKDLGSVSRSQWSPDALKSHVRKVQWALWKKADVAKFQQTIQTHCAALQSLLALIQM